MVVAGFDPILAEQNLGNTGLRYQNLDFKELNSSVRLSCDGYCEAHFESSDRWSARSDVTSFGGWVVDICATAIWWRDA
jgi:hypothetical protein